MTSQRSLSVNARPGGMGFVKSFLSTIPPSHSVPVPLFWLTPSALCSGPQKAGLLAKRGKKGRRERLGNPKDRLTCRILKPRDLSILRVSDRLIFPYRRTVRHDPLPNSLESGCGHSLGCSQAQGRQRPLWISARRVCGCLSWRATHPPGSQLCSCSRSVLTR